MQLNKDLIGVEFDVSHNNVYDLGGIELVRPEVWEFEDSSYSENGTKYQKNTNLKETNPQIATVTIENKNVNASIGDKVFVHYLSINNAQEIDGTKVIPFRSIFFKIKDDGYEMMEDVYLGKKVVKEAIKTESGIYLTSGDDIKEPLKIKLTHVPSNSPNFNVGDVVLTVDDFQYEIELLGETHVKLNTWDISIKIEQ